MQFVSEQTLDEGVIERAFNLGEVSGILWLPPAASSCDPAPLILMGQPGGIGMRGMYPRLAARARSAAARGLASISIELPGAGSRPPLAGAEQARADLRRAISAGEQPDRDTVDRLIPCSPTSRVGTSNGPTEAINGRLEHLRGSALGFRNLTNYIARALLETGGFRPQLHRGL